MEALLEQQQQLRLEGEHNRSKAASLAAQVRAHQPCELARPHSLQGLPALRLLSPAGAVQSRTAVLARVCFSSLPPGQGVLAPGVRGGCT